MRAQAQTLEGIAAAVLVIAGVSFALQATAVTPLSASTSNQHVENQLRATAGSLLDSAIANDSLVPALTRWNSTDNSFNDSSDLGYFVQGGPPGAFGGALNETFIDEQIATNVLVQYYDENGTRARQRLVYMGEPSDNAVSATRTVVLYNDTAVSGSYANVSEAAANDAFYAPDAAPGSELFNVMEVKIVVWRI